MQDARRPEHWADTELLQALVDVLGCSSGPELVGLVGGGGIVVPILRFHKLANQ